MVASRSVGLSTRVSTDVHLLLSERAKTEGLTLSSLAARILEENIPKVPGTELRPAPQGAAQEQLRTVQDRVENLQKWVTLLFGILTLGVPGWSLEQIPCPSCAAEAELQYFEMQQGTLTQSGFRCSQCDWRVTF